MDGNWHFGATVFVLVFTMAHSQVTLGNDVLLRECMEVVMTEARVTATDCATFSIELDGLRCAVLFACRFDLIFWFVDLVLAFVFNCVLDVLVAHVVGERCLVPNVAGGLSRCGHQYVTSLFAVLGLEPVLRQELGVHEP